MISEDIPLFNSQILFNFSHCKFYFLLIWPVTIFILHFYISKPGLCESFLCPSRNNNKFKLNEIRNLNLLKYLNISHSRCQCLITTKNQDLSWWHLRQALSNWKIGMRQTFLPHLALCIKQSLVNLSVSITSAFICLLNRRNNLNSIV